MVHQSESLASLSNNVALPSFTRIDAAAYYQIDDKALIQANIENVLHEEYFSSAHNHNDIAVGGPLSTKIS